METSTQQQPDYADIDLTRAIELLCEKDSRLAELLHRIIQLEKMTFGPSSSKRNDPIDPINPAAFLPFPGILELLAKVSSRAKELEQEASKDEEEKAEAKTKKKRKGRRSLVDDIPADLPRLTRARELTEKECECGCGGKLIKFKTETARRIDQIKIAYVDERVTTYYACRECEQVVSSSPDRESIVEGSILGPNILADFVYQRFGNHTPYHRLARELEQKGVPLSRSVIGRNVLKCGEALEPQPS